MLLIINCWPQAKYFYDLFNAHKETTKSVRLTILSYAYRHGTSSRKIKNTDVEKQFKACKGDQLIKQEEMKIGDTCLKPCKQYMN